MLATQYYRLLQEGPRLSEMPPPTQTGPYSSEPPSQAPPPYQPESLSQSRAPVTGYYTEQQHQAHYQSYPAPYAQPFAASSGPSPNASFYPQQIPAQPAAGFANQYPSSAPGQQPSLPRWVGCLHKAYGISSVHTGRPVFIYQCFMCQSFRLS